MVGALSSGPILARIIAHRVARTSCIDRLGIDVARKLRIEHAVAWVARHVVKAIDVQTDMAPNTLASFDEAGSSTRALPPASRSRFTPDRPSTSRKSRRSCATLPTRPLRKEAVIARLARTAKIVESAHVQLLFENLNSEPERAECTTCRTPSPRRRILAADRLTKPP